MKDLSHPDIEKFRGVEWEVRWLGMSLKGHPRQGCFYLDSPVDNRLLRIRASAGDDWDHVSVSRNNRCPNWPEMCYVKTTFFHDSEIVMQLHVPEKDYVNVHPYCLHLWHPKKEKIPLPPREYV